MKVVKTLTRRKSMKKNPFILICAAALVMAFAVASYAGYTAAQLAGKWDKGSGSEMILKADGTFTDTWKSSMGGNPKIFTGTFTITGDTMKLKRADGKNHALYRIVSLSADGKELTVKVGTMQVVWKKK
jgi:hypothetical protein